MLYSLGRSADAANVLSYTCSKTKRRRSDPVLWQKPLHQQKFQKGKVTTQTTPQKSSIKQQLSIMLIERKRKRSNSVLWQKPLHRQKKKQRDNTKTLPKTSITQRLRTDLGRSVRVTSNWCGWTDVWDPNPPTHHNSCVIEGMKVQVLFYRKLKFA